MLISCTYQHAIGNRCLIGALTIPVNLSIISKLHFCHLSSPVLAHGAALNSSLALFVSRPVLQTPLSSTPIACMKTRAASLPNSGRHLSFNTVIISNVFRARLQYGRNCFTFSGNLIPFWPSKTELADQRASYHLSLTNND